MIMTPIGMAYRFASANLNNIHPKTVKENRFDKEYIKEKIMQEFFTLTLPEPNENTNTNTDSIADKQIADTKKAFNSAVEARKLGVYLEKKNFFLKLFNFGINLFSTSLIIAVLCGSTAISFGATTPLLAAALLGSGLKLFESLADIHCAYVNLRAEQRGKNEEKYPLGSGSLQNLIYFISRKIYSKPDQVEKCKQISVHGSSIISTLLFSYNNIFSAHTSFITLITLIQQGIQFVSGITNLVFLMANRGEYEKLLCLKYHADLVATKEKYLNSNASSLSEFSDRIPSSENISGMSMLTNRSIEHDWALKELEKLDSKIIASKAGIQKSRRHAAIYLLFSKCTTFFQKSILFSRVVALKPDISSALPYASFILSSIAIGITIIDMLTTSVHLHKVRQEGKHQSGLSFDGDWLAFGISKLNPKKKIDAAQENNSERELEEGLFPTVVSVGVRGLLNLFSSSCLIPTKLQENETTKTSILYTTELLNGPVYGSTVGNLLMYENLLLSLKQKRDNADINRNTI